MENYVKTGEDKNFEYYRNDSEILSGDGEEEPYDEIINKRDSFNVKIADKGIIISKRTLNKIMILSDSQPEEQILFSLYKTVKHSQSRDTIRIQPSTNDMIKPNNPTNLDSLRGSKGVAFPAMVSKNNNNENKENERGNIPTKNKEKNISVSDPLSSQMYVIGNNQNSNNPNTEENVINIPVNEGSDNEEITFKKTENFDNVLLVTLPPQAVRAKWFYLLLSLVGIAYIILFIVGLADDDVGFMFNIFCICIIGVFLLLTGVFGFIKINNRIYDNNLLKIFTIICLIFGILGVVLVELKDATKDYLVASIIFGIFSVIFSILCIIWTLQLKKGTEIKKQQQMERLVDYKK